jgi:hypothetical protein
VTLSGTVTPDWRTRSAAATPATARPRFEGSLAATRHGVFHTATDKACG